MVLLAAALLVSCKKEAAESGVDTLNAAGEVAQGRSGKVIETMDAGGYTYIQVDTGSETFWAAAPQFAVAVGDQVSVPEGMPMQNFRSETLDREFDLLYFVQGVSVGGAMAGGQAPAQLPEGHPNVQSRIAAEAAAVDLSGIEKAAGGYTVADLFARRSELAGKEVKVRGKVVKFSAQIMGRNWIHVQDGTGAAGKNDLTVSTSETAKVGDMVVATGRLSTDKDFGYGYLYEVMIEDGKITVE